MKTLKCCVVLILATSVLGCKTERIHSALRANPQPPSSFLPQRELLKRQPDTFPFHYFYINSQAKHYENVYVAPVCTRLLRQSSSWSEFDKKMSGKLGSDVDFLADFMRKAYVQALRKDAAKTHLKVVDSTTNPNTLVLELAIVAFAPTKAELNVIGAASSIFVPVLGTVAAAALSPGSITIECRAKDAKTGELVAMYSNTEKDPAAVLSVSGFTWTRSARINIKMEAEQTAKVLSTKNYQQIKRDFPIKFLSLIRDGNLDEKSN